MPTSGTVVTMDVVGPTGVEWHDGLGRRGRHHLDRARAHELPSHRGPRSGLTRRDQIDLDRPGWTTVHQNTDQLLGKSHHPLHPPPLGIFLLLQNYQLLPKKNHCLWLFSKKALSLHLSRNLLANKFCDRGFMTLPLGIGQKAASICIHPSCLESLSFCRYDHKQVKPFYRTQVTVSFNRVKQKKIVQAGRTHFHW